MRQIGGFCPYCRKEVSFTWATPDNSSGSRSTLLRETLHNRRGMWVIGECPSCEGCVLMNFVRDQHDNQYLGNMYPTMLPPPTDGRIPEIIRKDLDESKRCLSVNSFRASAVMSRRAIQSACSDQGIAKNDLEKQIDELHTKGIITSQIKDWAHSVRWVGNDAAHPGNPEVTEDDAKGILDLAEQLMHILYVMPAISQERNKTHGRVK